MERPCLAAGHKLQETRLGRIKKVGSDSLVNWAMCEAANVAVRHDARMRAVYEAACRRHAGKHMLAIIVVAHKMVTIMWHMLKTRTPYESLNEELDHKPSGGKPGRMPSAKPATARSAKPTLMERSSKKPR